jgi:atypical dual specificity phosphatase
MTPPILREIRFGYLDAYPVAGMSEPWCVKMETTLALLQEQGIGAILTLTEDNLYGEAYTAAGFVNHHEPIEDCEPPSAEGMDRALGFIDNCLEEGYGVAVHCMEGRGRTGTVLSAWLGRRESLRPQDAIQRVYELREYTTISPSQRSFLNRYLNGRKE